MSSFGDRKHIIGILLLIQIMATNLQNILSVSTSLGNYYTLDVLVFCCCSLST